MYPLLPRAMSLLTNNWFDPFKETSRNTAQTKSVELPRLISSLSWFLFICSHSFVALTIA